MFRRRDARARLGLKESTHGAQDLRAELLCLEQDPYFAAVGSYYLDFEQVSDEEVKAILEAYRVAEPTRADNPGRDDAA